MDVDKNQILWKSWLAFLESFKSIIDILLEGLGTQKYPSFYSYF